jgi:hypothetical protein
MAYLLATRSWDRPLPDHISNGIRDKPIVHFYFPLAFFLSTPFMVYRISQIFPVCL